MGNTSIGKYAQLINADTLIIIEGMCRDGARDIDICDYLGISYNTFYKWLQKYPEFAEAVRNGKELVDRKVENALLKRCLGYDYIEIKKTKIRGEIVKEEKFRKHMAPDVTACCVWLNNRKPDEWKRNRDNYTLHETDNGITINIVKAKKGEENAAENQKSRKSKDDNK